MFDGVSVVPDEIFSILINTPNLTEIALRHDLKYAYGELDNDEEKLEADKQFEKDLVKDGCLPLVARLMFIAVQIGGDQVFELSYSWGFASN